MAKVGYPVVVKPRQGARSVGMLVVGDRSALDRAIAEAASPVVIQEYLLDERTEYAAGALVFDGRCDASIVMRRELGDGYTYRAFVDPYPELNRVVREMADGSDLRRKGTRDLWFDGHRTRAGRLLLYSPYVTHRLPELWPEPLQFRPASGVPGDPRRAWGGPEIPGLSVALPVTTLEVTEGLAPTS